MVLSRLSETEEAEAFAWNLGNPEVRSRVPAVEVDVVLTINFHADPSFETSMTPPHSICAPCTTLTRRTLGCFTTSKVTRDPNELLTEVVRIWSWKLLTQVLGHRASNDRRSWTEIDRRNNYLNDTYARTSRFPIPQADDSASSVSDKRDRTIQEVPSIVVEISSLEIFGTLCENKQDHTQKLPVRHLSRARASMNRLL